MVVFHKESVESIDSIHAYENCIIAMELALPHVPVLFRKLLILNDVGRYVHCFRQRQKLQFPSTLVTLLIWLR